jgi:hypothetical protein
MSEIYFKLTTEPYTTKVYLYPNDWFMPMVIENAKNKIYDDFQLSRETHKIEIIDANILPMNEIRPEDGPEFIPTSETVYHYKHIHNLGNTIAFYIRLNPTIY